MISKYLYASGWVTVVLLRANESLRGTVNQPVFVYDICHSIGTAHSLQNNMLLWVKEMTQSVMC